MAKLEIRVLGPMTVSVDGVPVDLNSRKQRALLALLALHAGQVLSVDRLVDDLWGEEPPPTARHALQVHVSNLRKLLGAETVLTERPGYVLRMPPSACDALRFEQLVRDGRRARQEGDVQKAASVLAEAQTLWRGSALADLLFEPFAARETARLEELRLAAEEDRAVAEVDLGRHAEVVGELEQLVAANPLRERLRGLLMLALYRSGRQVEALHTYKALRDQLCDELGLDPGPDLQQLEAAILRQDPELAAPTVTVRVRSAKGPSPAPVVDSTDSRRVATVMAVGLGGFDAAAGRLDPEDLQALLDRSVSLLSAVIAKYDGTIDHVVGGELTAVFGAPVAHEDDPERAVRAAVELRQLVHDHAGEFGDLGLRVGVCTGEVLFATAGPPERRRLTVIGDAVSEARRIQSLNAVVVNRATQAATRGVAAYEAVDGGFAVRSVVPVPQGRPLGSSPFVGRDHEVDLLLTVWRRTIAEQRPHLVSILGEPGVGKTRLLSEFERVADAGRVVSGRCLPYGKSLTYAPLGEALRAVADASAEDSPAIVRERVGALVASDEMARHMALLTGLDDERDRAAGPVDERTLHTSARRFFEELAREAPLCVVVEDVHWGDDALLDVLQAIVRRARGVPLLFVAVARPELVERRPDWGGGLTAYTSISLQPLDAGSTRELVEELGRAHGLDDQVIAEIATKSGGNPLFAEELVATVAEGDAATGVPASLTSLLLARLDALPAEQQTALRRAAVVGATFWPEALEALGVEAPVLDTIADLQDRDLLRVEPQSPLPGRTAYSFKHVLVRDAAYASLPRRERKALHRASADWLAGVAGDRIGEFSDSLAHHAMEAGQPERALRFLVTAADRSRRAASHRREEALLEEAVSIARTLGDDGLVAELRAQRGKALSRLALWGEARAELEAALTGLPDTTPPQSRRRAEVFNDLSTASFWLLDTAAIRQHAESALALAKKVDARDVQLAARAQLTSADSATGDVAAVLEGGKALVADASKWGLDPPYERLGAYSLQLYLTGDWDAAMAVAREAVRRGRENGDTQGVLWNMPHVAMAAAAAGRFDDAITIFDEARRFGQEYELVAGLPRCIAMSAGFHLDLFDYAGAENISQEARELGLRYFNPSAVSSGIDLLFNWTRRGDVGQADGLVDSVGAEVMKGGGWHGWLWRMRFTELQAEMAGAKGEHDSALELARSAIEQSHSKRRVKYEAMARLTAARSLIALGRKTEALEELRAARGLAGAVGHPTLQIAVAAEQLAVEPDETVAIEANQVVSNVLTNLSDPPLRTRFAESGPVRVIATMAGHGGAAR